jgi:hypothetical protein
MRPRRVVEVKAEQGCHSVGKAVDGCDDPVVAEERQHLGALSPAVVATVSSGSRYCSRFSSRSSPSFACGTAPW